jgi:hypothetical protein
MRTKSHISERLHATIPRIRAVIANPWPDPRELLIATAPNMSPKNPNSPPNQSVACDIVTLQEPLAHLQSLRIPLLMIMCPDPIRKIRLTLSTPAKKR